MKKTVLFLFFFTLSITIIKAQEVIPAAGGNTTGIGGSVSYTVGQVVYSTNSGTSGFIAEGVQQPYEISETIGIKKAKDIILICTAYPNPTKDLLTINVKNFKISNLYYQIYDLNGKLIENKKLTQKETTISVSNLPSGTYLIKVVKSKALYDREIKTFKIIKNH